MGIQALPPTTVRAIGATQVLNDPATVIKELIDNALDADATSIAIEITSNTIDSIQVRDNGHGIPTNDRPLVARPHCTSKISSEDDLTSVGGSSLGFRGEALASVAGLSGSLTINTRVEGEQVATALKINQHGEVEGQELASLPVGTSVKISDFIKAYPVRRQVALKHADRTLRNIKHLLQSYAFTRPHIRLSFRVLKAKTDTFNWTYAPRAGGNADDAAFKIVGAACASQCTWSAIDHKGFALQAFLPRSDADVGKVSNRGSFLSIDLRPVSSSRGTPKQIIKIFRETLKKANASFDGAKEPFIYMEIKCSPASYDANVEPAKDDVLFEDPEVVVQAVRQLFEGIYPSVGDRAAEAAMDQIRRGQGPGHPGKNPNPIIQDHSSNTDSSVQLGSCDDLVVGANPVPEYTRQKAYEEAQTGHEIQQLTRTFRTNMYGCDEEDLDLIDARPPTGRTEANIEEHRQVREDVRLSNPWVMAKLNAKSQPRAAAGNDNHTPIADVAREGLLEPASAHERPPIDLEPSGLPTPYPSSSSPPRQQHFHPSDHVPNLRLARNERVIGSQSLPPPQMTVPSHSSADFDTINPPSAASQQRQVPEHNYDYPALEELPPSGTPLEAIHDASARRRSPRKPMQQPNVNTPFSSPAKRQQQHEGAHSAHQGVGEQRAARNNQNRPYLRNNPGGLVVQGELGDLIHKPRPLTPPRHNRDMRDFVTSLDLTGDNSATPLVESRNYPQPNAGHSMHSRGQPQNETDTEIATNSTGVVCGRGFVPASELDAVQAHFGTAKHGISHQSKRRKTSDSRVLREVSGNATTIMDDDHEGSLLANRRAASRRRSTTGGNKARRTKSSLLPLERIPMGQGVHNTVKKADIEFQTVSRLARKMDQVRSLHGWNEAASDAYNVFSVSSSPLDTTELAAKLRELLVDQVSDEEMVQDLGVLVREALTSCPRGDEEVQSI